MYVGGSFSWVTNSDGTAIPASLVAAWDGSDWTALGSGLFHGDPLRSVRGLALASDGTLYAGGLFNSSGGVPISLVAQWDGSGWSALGSGVYGNGFNGAVVFALTTSGTSLFVGGAFTRAGTVSSAYAAQAILGPPSIPARSCRMTPNNESYYYGFDVSGGALQRVIIEASTDLTNWGPVQTNVLGSGPLNFVDPNADKYPMRFYRVQQVK